MAKGPRGAAQTTVPTKPSHAPADFFGTGKPKTEEEKKEQQEELGNDQTEQFLAMPKVTRARAATKKHDADNFDF